MTLRLGIGAPPSLGRVVPPDMDDALGASLKARSLQMKPKTAGVGRLGGAGLCACRWLWMKTHCKLGGLQTNHIPLQYATCSHGVASAEDSIIVSRIWCQYFKNNPEFWDDGINNLPLSIPRSEPESIQEIYPESGALTPDRKAASDRRSGVGLRSGRKLRRGFGTGNAVEAESDERSWIASILQHTKSGQGMR